MNYKIISVFLLFLMSSCYLQENENNKVISNEVYSKYESYKRNKINKCVKSALEDAETYVDSIITEYTRNSIKNNIDFPEKPQRNNDTSLYHITIDSFSIDTFISKQ